MLASTTCKLHSSKPWASLLQNHRVIVECAARAEVWLASQGSKNIANVVRRIDSFCESRIPFIKYTFHNLYTCKVDIVDGWVKAALVGVEEVDRIRLARVGAIKIGSGTHYYDTAEIGKVVNSAS